MAEIHVECPTCKSNIIMKLQSEVFTDDSHRRIPISHIQRARIERAYTIARRLREMEAKVNIQLKDGTLREVNSDEELLAIFIEFEQRQRFAERVQEMTVPQINQGITDLEQRINTLKKLSWSLTKEDKRPVNNFVIRPLEKQLQLLAEEKERRTQREQEDT